MNLTNINYINDRFPLCDGYLLRLIEQFPHANTSHTVEEKRHGRRNDWAVVLVASSSSLFGQHAFYGVLMHFFGPFLAGTGPAACSTNYSMSKLSRGECVIARASKKQRYRARHDRPRAARTLPGEKHGRSMEARGFGRAIERNADNDDGGSARSQEADPSCRWFFVTDD